MKGSKKILALLLVLAMGMTMLAGCSSTPTATEAPDATAAPEPPAEEPAASEEPAETRPNRLIYGSSTEVSGDIGPGAWWTNNATDQMIRNLINDYGVVTFDQDGAMVENASVLDGAITSVENEDGSKTFTVKIKQGLTYNNGEPITAADYCAYALVEYSPAAKEAGSGMVPLELVGSAEYQNGDVNYISGLRLVDEYTYAITVSADVLPYYYEEYYANLTPLYLPMYASAALTVKDDGQGVYLDGGELVADEINAARYMYDSPVSAGPYTLVSLDTGTLQATLELNPNYAGNFEGQKPSIQTIVITKSEVSTAIDSLRTGAVDLLDTLSDGNTEINPALDLVEEGGYDYVSFERNGYGKLQFACDFGPTQFPAVRQAVALLLDRNEFANQFCAGYGSVVDGPYGLCMWMYKESQEFFADNIDSYAYNPDRAVEILEADGWTLNADGTPYSGTGLRYKEVTAEEAGDYALNVTLDDGRILMPLHIMWASSEDNPVSELLAVMLANGEQTAAAGMEIEMTVMSFTDLLNYIYRDATVDERYGVPTYGMFNLATGFTQMYDQAFAYSEDPAYMGTYNNNFILDDELAQLAWDMVYGVEAGDDAAYLDMWQKFMDRWNELLPDVPLYSNIYYTVFPDWLQGYDQSSYWDFSQAVLYASIENAE